MRINPLTTIVLLSFAWSITPACPPRNDTAPQPDTDPPEADTDDDDDTGSDGDGWERTPR